MLIIIKLNNFLEKYLNFYLNLFPFLELVPFMMYIL